MLLFSCLVFKMLNKQQSCHLDFHYILDMLPVMILHNQLTKREKKEKDKIQKMPSEATSSKKKNINKMIMVIDDDDGIPLWWFHYHYFFFCFEVRGFFSVCFMISEAVVHDFCFMIIIIIIIIIFFFVTVANHNHHYHQPTNKQDDNFFLCFFVSMLLFVVPDDPRQFSLFTFISFSAKMTLVHSFRQFSMEKLR